MRLLIVIGVILVGVAGLWTLAGWGGLSQQMPTQLPPRRAARYPFAAGVVLIATGVVVGLSRGLG